MFRYVNDTYVEAKIGLSEIRMIWKERLPGSLFGPFHQFVTSKEFIWKTVLERVEN